MNFSDYGTDEEYYEHINQTILNGNVMNISVIIMEVDYGAIGADDSSCHGYYIIIFYSYSYTLQEVLSIDDQVISSGEMISEETCFPMNINYCYYVLKKIQ